MRGIGADAGALFGQPLDQPRQVYIALKLELRNAAQPRGAPRIAGDQHDIASIRRIEVEREMVRRRCRRAVLVKADEREIEAIAGKLEIIGIATERRDAMLRREHETHIGEAAVGVACIAAALVERDDLTSLPRLLTFALSSRARTRD